MEKHPFHLLKKKKREQDRVKPSSKTRDREEKKR